MPLQLRQNASVVAQGCADFSSDSSDRNHSFTPDPWRASPSLRPGLSFRYTQVRISSTRGGQSRFGARTLQAMKMTKLKIGSIEDDKPVSLTVKLPAMVYRDLTAYAEILKREGRQSTADPTTLVAPMLARFMATDRAFRKLRRGMQQKGSASAAAKSE